MGKTFYGIESADRGPDARSGGRQVWKKNSVGGVEAETFNSSSPAKMTSQPESSLDWTMTFSPSLTEKKDFLWK